MERLDLGVKRGETFRKVLLFETDDGEAVDLTGFSGFCQVRPEPESEILTAAADVEITPGQGRVILMIRPEVTAALEIGCYAYDFAMSDAEGAVRFYIGGRFSVWPAVTRL